MFIRGYYPRAIDYDRQLRTLARTLRKRSTPAEIKLWQYLRANRTGYKFRRQHPLHRYIVDFYCYELMLVIEIDGGVHKTKKQHDEVKNILLQRAGYTVLRFSNEAVIHNIDFVLKVIDDYIAGSPSPRIGEGWGEVLIMERIKKKC